jgi:hypothetical protein
VQTGDYIVYEYEIKKGMSIAIHEWNDRWKFYTLTVGRSWENKLTEGPKWLILW